VIRNWLREPLLHFLLIGVALFVVWSYGSETDNAPSDQILVSMSDVERLAALWQDQWNRPPTPQELGGLLEDHINEEVLVREALAMGLDRDDTVIRRRLAQKMEFLSTDLADQIEPTEDELENWLDEHVDRYRSPAMVSFVHVYLNSDTRGDRLSNDGAAILARLRADPDRALPWTLGDRFMLPHEYERRSTDYVNRQFGRDFGTALLGLEPGLWSGPISSGFGAHLIRVDERVASKTPTLDEARRFVMRDLLSRRRAEVNDALHQQLRSRYEIVFDEQVQQLAATRPEDQP
jgi:hypothetical protein